MVDKAAIGVGVSLSFVLFSLLLFFLLRGKRRLKENLVKKNSTVSVNAEVNYFLIEYFKNLEQLSSRHHYSRGVSFQVNSI